MRELLPSFHTLLLLQGVPAVTRIKQPPQKPAAALQQLCCRQQVQGVERLLEPHGGQQRSSAAVPLEPRSNV